MTDDPPSKIGGILRSILLGLHNYSLQYGEREDVTSKLRSMVHVSSSDLQIVDDESYSQSPTEDSVDLSVTAHSVTVNTHVTTDCGGCNGF